ncbi:MAG: RICIN domain-containing protein [Spirochaetes bacterium]|nr:RICIN domain-containing protein [Spirochaetota bacterium]
MIKHLLLLSAALFAAYATAFGNSDPDTLMFYTIEAAPGGTVIDIEGGGTANDVPAIMYRKNGGSNQQFRFILYGNEGWHLIQGRGSGKYLTVANDNVVQRSLSHNYDTQLWRVTAAGDGYRFITKNGGAMATGKAPKKNNDIVIVTRSALPGKTWILSPALNERETAAMKAAEAWIRGNSNEYKQIIGSAAGSEQGALLFQTARFIHTSYHKPDAAVPVYLEARKAGYDEPNLFESLADAYHGSKKSPQGAACLDDGYRERLSILVSAPSGTGSRASRDYEKKRKALLETAAALIDFHAGKLNSFTRGPEIYNDLSKRGISLNHRRFQRSCAESAFWAGNEAFASGDYKAAAARYDVVMALDGVSGEPGKIIKRYDLDRILSILERRRALGTIMPDYIQKHTALFVLTFSAQFKGKENIVSIYNSYTEQDPRVKKTIINQDLMARMVEAFTGGRLSIRYDRHFLKKSTLTDFYEWKSKKRGMVCSPQMNSFTPEDEIIDIMGSTVADTDVYEIYWDKTGLPRGEYICFGGSTTGYPVIPYTLSIPRRGFMENHIGRSTGLGLVFHEYFHTVERVGGFKTQDDEENIISYYPEYAKTRSALGYYDYMFTTKLAAMVGGHDAKKLEGGWRAFSFSSRSPFRMQGVKLKRLTKLALDIPLDRRKESRMIQEKARAKDKAGRKDEAFALYEKAFGINPSFVEFYKLSARRSAAAGRNDEAARSMETYLSHADSSGDARWLGNLLIEKLDRAGDAERYYAEAYRLGAGRTIARISLDAGWRFFKKGNNDKALTYFEKGLTADNCDEKLECLYLKGEIIYRQGYPSKGMDMMEQAMDGGLSAKKWYKERFEKMVKKAGGR